jgi:hypothetical protein
MSASQTSALTVTIDELTGTLDDLRAYRWEIARRVPNAHARCTDSGWEHELRIVDAWERPMTVAAALRELDELIADRSALMDEAES